MNNTTKSTVQLDIAFVEEEGETAVSAIFALLGKANRPNLSFTLVDEFGPAGGWPVYEFTGKQEDIDSLLTAYLA